MSRNPVLYKSLVVGVIVLFIGVGINPAFAVTSANKDSDDDCDICPSVNNIMVDRYSIVLDKLEITSDLKQDISWNNTSICDFLESIMIRISPWFGLFLNIYIKNEENPISLRYFIGILGMAILILFLRPIGNLYFYVFDCFEYFPYLLK